MGACLRARHQDACDRRYIGSDVTGRESPGQFVPRISGTRRPHQSNPRRWDASFQRSSLPAGKVLYRATKLPCLLPCRGGWHGRWSVCNEGSFTLADAIGASHSTCAMSTSHSPEADGLRRNRQKVSSSDATPQGLIASIGFPVWQNRIAVRQLTSASVLAQVYSSWLFLGPVEWQSLNCVGRCAGEICQRPVTHSFPQLQSDAQSLLNWPLLAGIPVRRSRLPRPIRSGNQWPPAKLELAVGHPPETIGFLSRREFANALILDRLNAPA